MSKKKKEKKKVIIHFSNGEETLCGEYVCGGNYHVGNIPDGYEYDGIEASDWRDMELGIDDDDEPPVQHTCVEDFVTCKECKEILKKKRK